MGRKTRIAVAEIAMVTWMVLMSLAFDHELPAHTAGGWAFYLGGFVVITTGWMLIDSRARARRER